MLGFSRAGVVRLRLQRRLLSVAAAQVNNTTSQAPPPRDLRKTNRQPEGPVIASEQLQLQQKFKESLDGKKEIKSLFDVIEIVEWRGGAVWYPTLDKASKLVVDPAQDVAALSDRQLAVLLSVFGDVCNSVSRTQRAQLLASTLAALEGRGVNLGPLARNAVLEASIDNGKKINVVEELKAWESAGLNPDENTYRLLARTYGGEGNTQGIVDIINHMKSLGMTVGEPIIDSLTYSMAVGGHYAQADAIVAKFSSAMNEVRLRCSIALGAVARQDGNQVISALAAIPEKARPAIAQNNKFILDVMFELLERGQMETAEKVRPYLCTVPGGSVLTDWQPNGYVLARVRRARSENLIEAALAMYRIVNPAYKNSNIEDQLKNGVFVQLRSADSSVEKTFALAKQLKQLGVVSNSELFVLESSLSTPHFRSVFNQLKEENKLAEFFKEKPELKRPVARKLSDELTNSKLSADERSRILADVATVFFQAQNSGENVGEFYPIVFSLCGQDVPLALSTLSHVTDPRVSREFSTAVLHQIFYHKSDPLFKEKLDKFLASDQVSHVSASFRLRQEIERIVLNKGKREGEADMEQLHTAARIVALDFPAEKAPRPKELFVVKMLVDILGNELLSDERAALFVDCLEKELRVSLTFDELAAAKKVLTEKKQEHKAGLLNKLKRSGQTLVRWQNSSIEQLQDELQRMQSRGKPARGVVDSISTVMLKQLQQQKPLDCELALNVLSNSVPQSKRDSFLAKAVWQDAMRESLSDRRLELAESLWNVKPNLTKMSADSALMYISVLFAEGQTARADEVCEELRASTATITGRSLEMVGRVVGEVGSDKISDLTAYLKQKFNLKNSQTRRIVGEMTMRKLNSLIEAGNLEEAFNLACEESRVSGVAFGQFELLAAAFKNNNSTLAQNVYNMIVNSHNKTIAVLDLAYAMLEGALTEQAAKLFSTNGLRISTRKLEFFVKRAVEGNRPDVLSGLFAGLCEDDRATTVDLNNLLVHLARLYYKANDLEGLSLLEQEVEKKSFPIGQEMRTIFDNLRKTRGKTEAN